ncbi:MAG: response regulator [Myxococcales bacterium]|nr:response regulator [Myxococcales bacterium]MBK7195989.1 response regulator [Myxococcales bacterium]
MSNAFGRWLLELGALPDEDALDDVLARQSERMPTASVAYVLGYADERSLAGVLAAATGRPAIVLDESVIDLTLLDGVVPEAWLGSQMMPVAVDGGDVYVAAAHPEQLDARVLGRLGLRGTVVVAIALAVTVARTVRAGLAARRRGDEVWAGASADPADAGRPRAVLVGVDEDATVDGAAPADAADAARAVKDDSTKEIHVRELIDRDDDSAIDPELPSQVPILAPRGSAWPTDGPWSRGGSGSSVGSDPGLDPEGAGALDGDVADLVRTLSPGPAATIDGTARVLIVDDDYATRQLLVKEFAPRGYQVATAASGDDAVAALADSAPDVVIADILLPGVDGFRLCRAIKRTARLRDVGVILMSAVIESGRVTPEVLLRYSADGYAAKPLDTIRLLRIVREHLGRRREALRAAGDEQHLRRALDRYDAGDGVGAIAVLRDRLDEVPTSVRVRFALANMLQRAHHRDDAVREYEAVVGHAPDYFPALTRLAYLYYERGETRRAVETWRRALPHCPDRDLRKNIELFVRSLAG